MVAVAVMEEEEEALELNLASIFRYYGVKIHFKPIKGLHFPGNAVHFTQKKHELLLSVPGNASN